MTFRDFDQVRKERARETEPIRFRLGGQDFTCAPQPTLADVFDLLDAPEAFDDGAPVAAGVRALTLFIDKLLIDDKNRRRFKKLLRAHDVDGFDIVALGEWLVEQYTGRPTLPSTDFSDGRPEPTEPSNGSPFAPVADSVT